jgi:hypothetical protein
MSSTQELVHERAYDLWQQAGGPEGRSDEFWFAAERELEYGESEYETATTVEEAGVLVPMVGERSENAVPDAASEDL